MDHFFKAKLNNNVYIINAQHLGMLTACVILTQYLFKDPYSEDLHPNIFYPKAWGNGYNFQKYCFIKIEPIDPKSVDPKAKVITWGMHKPKNFESYKRSNENEQL